MLLPRFPVPAFLADPSTRLACLLGALLVGIVVLVSVVQLVIGLMMWGVPIALVVGGAWAWARRGESAEKPPTAP